MDNSKKQEERLNILKGNNDTLAEHNYRLFKEVIMKRILKKIVKHKPDIEEKKLREEAISYYFFIEQVGTFVKNDQRYEESLKLFQEVEPDFVEELLALRKYVFCTIENGLSHAEAMEVIKFEDIDTGGN